MASGTTNFAILHVGGILPTRMGYSRKRPFNLFDNVTIPLKGSAIYIVVSGFLHAFFAFLVESTVVVFKLSVPLHTGHGASGIGLHSHPTHATVRQINAVEMRVEWWGRISPEPRQAVSVFQDYSALSPSIF